MVVEIDQELIRQATNAFERNYKIATRIGEYTEELRRSYIQIISLQEQGQIKEGQVEKYRSRAQNLHRQTRA